MDNDPLIPLLRSAKYPALLLLAYWLLHRAGFYQVQFMGRIESLHKSQPGGFELLAFADCAGFRQKVVVKVIRHPFKSRMFHELAGVAMKERADFAILIAPHKLSYKMREVQEACTSVRVEVIDGARFAESIRLANIGIRRSGEPDFVYFSRLDRTAKNYIQSINEHGQ